MIQRGTRRLFATPQGGGSAEHAGKHIRQATLKAIFAVRGDASVRTEDTYG